MAWVVLSTVKKKKTNKNTEAIVVWSVIFFGELFLPFMREEASINLSKLRRSFEANSTHLNRIARKSYAMLTKEAIFSFGII